jgi:hypothetical protein
MKLTLSQLERARREPKKFAASMLRTNGGMRPTFPMYWVHAAKLYHRLRAKNDPNAEGEALSYFTQHCQAKLFNEPDFGRKLSQFAGKLDVYIASYNALNYPFVQVNKRVEFDKIAGHIISGRVDRLDINPGGGYVATNFEASESDWKYRLRVPITQQALANELGCPPSEVKIGMFCIETGSHSYVTIPNSDIEGAVSELKTLLNTVEAEYQRLRKSKP